MAGGFDLMSLLPGAGQEEQQPAPQAQAQPAPAPAKGGWGDYLSDPVNRAFLVSAGLQMATGGWGNLGQQAAQSFGAGASAASGTQQAMFENQEKKAETEKERASRREVATIGARSREEVAQLRSEAMLERTKMNLSKAAPDQAIKYRTEARKVVEGNLENMSLPQTERETMIEDLASRMYSTDQARKGAAAPAGGGSVAAPAEATTTKVAAGKKADANTLWKKVQTHPDFSTTMSTPEGREQLKKAYPELAKKLDNWAYFMDNL